MRRMMIACCMVAICSAGPAFAARWEPVETLGSQRPVVVLVKGKKRAYFRLAPGAPLTVPVEGPARLRVISRAELRGGGPSVVSYRLRASSGGASLKEIATETSSSAQARRAADGARLGKSRRLVLDVPAGRHAVMLASDEAPVLVRIMLGSARASVEPMISLVPISAPRTVSLHEGERIVPYYSVLPDRPVRLRVVGPTTLELAARLDCDETMHGSLSYRLAVSEKGRRLRVLGFRTVRSATARYAEIPDRVPSRVDHVRMTVPEGLHEFDVELLSPRRGAAGIHARIPQSSLGSAE